MIKKIFQFKDVLGFLDTYPSLRHNDVSLSFIFDDGWAWLANTIDSVGGTRVNQLYASVKGVTYNIDDSVWEISAEGQAILNKVIQRYYDWNCFEIVENPFISSNDIINEKSLKFFQRFLNIYNNTYDKYVALLKNLEAVENALVDGKRNAFHSETDTSGTGSNRFNDTPQDTGLFDDDSHTTNINLSETSGESDTDGYNTNNDLYNVEKLKLIQEKYVDVMLEWSNEFKRLFYLEVC